MDDTDRRQFDNERWTKIEVSLGKLETHIEDCKVFKKQIVANKDNIVKLKTKQALIVAIGSVIGLTVIGSMVKSVFAHLAKH